MMTLDAAFAAAHRAEHDQPVEHGQSAADAFTERLFDAMLGTFDVLAVAIGDQLDLYRPLLGRQLTSGELAAERGVDERYAREWLEQQCVSGIVTPPSPPRTAGSPCRSRTRRCWCPTTPRPT